MLKKYPTLLFVLHRSGWYFLTFLVAITINFFLPRFGADPIALVMSKMKGSNAKVIHQKRVAFMKEFGLVKTSNVAATNDGHLLLDVEGNPVSFQELEKSGKLVQNELETFWGSSVIVNNVEDFRASLLPVFKEKGGDLADFAGKFAKDSTALKDFEGDALLNKLRETLSIEEIKSLKGIEFTTGSVVYTIDTASLNEAAGSNVSFISAEGDIPFVVTKENEELIYTYKSAKDLTPVPYTAASEQKIADAKAAAEVAKAKAKAAAEAEGKEYKDDDKPQEFAGLINAIDAETIDIVASTEVLNNITVSEKSGTEEFAPIKRPLVKQYFSYLAMVLQGDLGTSFNKYPKKVNTIVAEALPWTLAIQFPSIVLGWLVGNILGALAAYKRGIFDKIFFPMAMLSNSIPFFAVGMILVWVFAEMLPIFPASSGYAVDVVPGFTWAFISSAALHYILPFLSVFPVMASGQATGMRSMGIYELGTGYVKYAKTLGIKENKILFYIFRNAMLPQLAGLAIQLGVMIGGALITELIFSYPGLGMALLSAAQNNDYPLIQGAALLVTVTVLIANFSVDILIGFFDPRVKAGRTGA